MRYDRASAKPQAARESCFEEKTMPADGPHSDAHGVTRRVALQSALAAAGGAAALLGPGVAGGAAPRAALDPRRASAKRYDMKKSIHLWAFPYPGRMSLK